MTRSAASAATSAETLPLASHGVQASLRAHSDPQPAHWKIRRSPAVIPLGCQEHADRHEKAATTTLMRLILAQPPQSTGFATR